MEHPSLKNPKTSFEKTVANFAKRLREIHDEEVAQHIKLGIDVSNCYENGLEKADPKDIAEIEKRWKLPEKYLWFLKNFSPKEVYLEGGDFMNGLMPYGADLLIKRQEGYAWSYDKEEIFEDWPKNLLVIGDDSADPYCLDLDAIEDGDAPVLMAYHGTGSWDFEPFADSFEEFLQILTELEINDEEDDDF